VKLPGKRRGGQSDRTPRRASLAGSPTYTSVDGVKADADELRRLAARHQTLWLAQ